jgi:hypothetical protein
MPSPFPGMDPYLESPWLWRDVHLELISTSRALLVPQLQPRYVARLEERVYISTEDDPDKAFYYPDLKVAERNGHGRPKAKSGKKVAAHAKADPPVVLTTITPEEVREARIEIRGQTDQKVIAVIEVVSPTNKLPGSAGRESFLQKKREVLDSPAHWVEIDLLRAGARPGFDAFLPAHEYAVHVSPAGLRPQGHVWPIGLRDRLPTIENPLGKKEPPALLDLQAVLTAAYDRARYDYTIDYTQPPTPPLPPEHQAWADKLLKKKRLR